MKLFTNATSRSALVFSIHNYYYQEGVHISFPVFYILFPFSLVGSLHLALHLIEIMFIIVVEAIWLHVVEVSIVEVGVVKSHVIVVSMVEA